MSQSMRIYTIHFLKDSSLDTHKTAGHLSRVLWEKDDLQIQTELRYRPTPHVTTIMVVNGAVIVRSENPWPISSSQTQDQIRVSDYHKRLTLALERLRKRQWINLEELKPLADKLVKIALRLSGSLASEAMSLIPGTGWAAVLGDEGEIIEAKPDNKLVEPWCETSTALLESIVMVSKLLEGGPVDDVSLRTGKGYVLLFPRGKSLVMTSVKSENLPEARQIMKRLVAG